MRRKHYKAYLIYTDSDRRCNFGEFPRKDEVWGCRTKMSLCQLKISENSRCWWVIFTSWGKSHIHRAGYHLLVNTYRALSISLAVKFALPPFVFLFYCISEAQGKKTGKKKLKKNCLLKHLWRELKTKVNFHFKISSALYNEAWINSTTW